MTWATDHLDRIKAGTSTLPPVVQTLKLGRIDDWGEGWVRKRWTSSPEILNSDGSMFGGYIAALADQMLALAAMSTLLEGAALRTTNLQVQFLKLARGEPLIIEARVIAQSKQTITVEAEIRNEPGDLIAKAGAQQLITRWERSDLTSPNAS